MSTVFIFPGQGSQYVGMGKKLYNNYDFAKRIFDKANTILGYDIREICFNDPNNQLNQTKYTQPSIFIYSFILDSLLKKNNIYPNAVAGHSLGEITALVSSKCISFEDALIFIKKRAEIMYEIGNQVPGKMAAIIDTEYEELKTIIQKNKLDITIANINSNNQNIISGQSKIIDDFIINAKSKGIKRILPINVSGAFHSPLMKKARIYLMEVIDSIKFQDITIPIYQNYSAKKTYSAKTIKNNLINQIDNPVRWHELICNLRKDNYVNFVEVGPKKVLTKLNNNIIPNMNLSYVENRNEFLEFNV